MYSKFSRISFALVFLILSAIAFTGCDDNHASAGSPPISVTTAQPAPVTDYKVTRRTVGGLLLASDEIIPTDVDNVADASFAKLVRDSRAADYTENLEANLFTIIVKQDCVPSLDGTLSIKLRSDGYDGTIFDKHNTLGEETDPAEIAKGIVYKKDGIGEVTAAERVVPVYNPLTKTNEPSNTYTICYADASLMTNTVRYGGEHIILFRNDRERYKQTENHGTSGIPHPLISEGN